MISWIQGIVKEIESGSCTINVGGIGYQLFCTPRFLSELECETSREFVVYTEVREDAIKLYGFSSKLDKQVFLLLNLVKGIGPKSALETLSKVQPRQLLACVGRGDVAALQSIKGIGKKTAERIVVELQDKVASYALDHRNNNQTSVGESERDANEEIASDALSALMTLGFQRKEADAALKGVFKSGINFKDSGSLVAEALKNI